MKQEDVVFNQELDKLKIENALVDRVNETTALSDRDLPGIAVTVMLGKINF